jgi:hypothetical protein
MVHIVVQHRFEEMVHLEDGASIHLEVRVVYSILQMKAARDLCNVLVIQVVWVLCIVLVVEVVRNLHNVSIVLNLCNVSVVLHCKMERHLDDVERNHARVCATMVAEKDRDNDRVS